MHSDSEARVVIFYLQIDAEYINIVIYGVNGMYMCEGWVGVRKRRDEVSECGGLPIHCGLFNETSPYIVSCCYLYILLSDDLHDFMLHSWVRYTADDFAYIRNVVRVG